MRAAPNRYRNVEEEEREPDNRQRERDTRGPSDSPFISSSPTGVSMTAEASASLERSLSFELDRLLLRLPRLGVTLLPPPESEW